MTVHQMCTCGTKVEGATVEEAWQRLDEHCDQAHGPRFPKGSRVSAANPYRRANRAAPLTDQAGRW